jgi:hypothetical protein
MTSIRIRYVAPIIPPLVILATFGLHRITRMVAIRKSDQAGWIGSSLVGLVLAIILTLNASYIVKQFQYVDPFEYISGRVSRNNYIANYRPEYSTYQYANRHLPDDVKILGLFLGNRLYYSDRDLRFEINEFKNIVARAGSENYILTELKEQGYTNLMIRFDLFNQWTNKQFDNKKKEMLKTFFALHVKHLFSKDGYGLFELKNF